MDHPPTPYAPIPLAAAAGRSPVPDPREVTDWAAVVAPLGPDGIAKLLAILPPENLPSFAAALSPSVLTSLVTALPPTELDRLAPVLSPATLLAALVQAGRDAAARGPARRPAASHGADSDGRRPGHPPRRRCLSNAPTVRARGRFHHGNLKEAAIARAREMVEKWGIESLTVRGVARELGVTPPALLYHFGRREWFRQAVAERAYEPLDEAIRMRGPGPREVIREAAARWLDFAADNPNTYRLIFGEGWRLQSSRQMPAGPRYGLHTAAGLFAFRARRQLERARHADVMRIDDPQDVAEYVAAAVHGLAVARLSGIPEERVKRSLDQVVDHIPTGPYEPLMAALRPDLRPRVPLSPEGEGGG